MSDDENNLIPHHMEGIFEIEDGTTAPLPQTYVQKKTIKHELYDDKDCEIEDQYQEVFNMAMEAFTSQNDNVELIDPKYKARAQEVAATFLTTALQAANAKANLKQTKEKNAIAAQKINGAGTTDKITFEFDRNELLKQLKSSVADTEKEVLPDQEK